MMEVMPAMKARAAGMYRCRWSDGLNLKRHAKLILLLVDSSIIYIYICVYICIYIYIYISL